MRRTNILKDVCLENVRESLGDGERSSHTVGEKRFPRPNCRRSQGREKKSDRESTG